MKRGFKNTIPFRPLKIESYSVIFSSLAKIALNVYKHDIVEAIHSAMDLLPAFGMEGTEERLGWELVIRSVVQAAGDLLKDNQNSFIVKDKETIIEKIKSLKHDKEIKIDSAFFKNPKESEFVKAIQSILLQWFKLDDIEEHKSETMAARFPSFFVYALNDEWVKNSKKYERLLIPMEIPISKQAIMEDDWEKYKAYLDRQTQESIFTEAFSLSQIYIPLCAYYKDNKDNKDNKEKRIVVDLHNAINEWLKKADKDDSVRIISGGPGSGKSSFLKMFAAGIADTHNVLFIPLHHLSLKDDIEEDINKFLVSNKYFEQTPIGNEGNLLIIFDGLDELSMQGKIGVEAAHDFRRQIERLLVNYNHLKHQISIIITGRDLPIREIEADFRKNNQVLHLLPYYVEKEKEIQSPAFEYIDENTLLREDKRDLWWEKYGKLTGKNYKKLPEELNCYVSIEITAQPLLNYLLALSYGRGKIQFSDNTNRNELYSDLISIVYERGYQGEQSKYRLLEHIEKPEFEQVLEEIAVSAWQGAGRTTTVEAIKKRCEKSKISNVLIKLRESAEKGVLNLLTAFYFRHSGKMWEGSEAFEFTHKSFGEYLTARRIVRQIQNTHETLIIKKTDDGLTNETALKNWIELCCNVPLDADIHKFLCDEMSRYERFKVKSWQDMLSELISYMLEFGMPFENISPRPKYIDETWQSRNAEETLLAALSACSQFTNEISDIKWKDRRSAGEWFSKLCGQPNNIDFYIFTYSCLNNINLSSADLRDANLRRANLKGADLKGADLRGANLNTANLSDANLNSANLSDANLNTANLSDANLDSADFSFTNLSYANLSAANVRHADLIAANMRHADLAGTNLYSVDLSYANLSAANLSAANLTFADLNATNLTFANLTGANLSDADLDCADLSAANLTGANLTGANLSAADLSYANLSAANLTDANLTGANLTYAYLSAANLTGANLTGANLTYAYLSAANLTGANLTGTDLSSSDL